MYHLTFDANGIDHDLAFEVSLLPETDMEEAWENLALLSRESVVCGRLEEFWNRKKTTSPTSIVRALFTEEVLNALRRELHRKSDVRLELDDVANSLRRLLNPEVLTEDIKIRKARKKRKRAVKPGQEGADSATEETDLERAEEDGELDSEEGAEGSPSSQDNPSTTSPN